MTALLTTNLGTTPLLGRGKVRDLYAVDDALLLVATDRISAFDHVLGTGIPGKGKILTQISLFWFDLCSRHCSQSSDCHQCCRVPCLAAAVCGPAGRPVDAGEAREDVSGGMRGARLPCGVGLEGIQGDGTVCGIALPAGLEDGSRLPEPLFTPATKSQDGAHDENISFAQRLKRRLERTRRRIAAADAGDLCKGAAGMPKHAG